MSGFQKGLHSLQLLNYFTFSFELVLADYVSDGFRNSPEFCC